MCAGGLMEDKINKLIRMQSSCRYCLKTGHTAFYCPSRPRKPLQAKKPMRKRGKHFKQWMETRDKWLEQNKAPYHFCYICNKMMTRTQLTLDHIKSRARHPELRYKLSNLAPCCAPCNTAKGSRSLEEFLIERKEAGAV